MTKEERRAWYYANHAARLAYARVYRAKQKVEKPVKVIDIDEKRRKDREYQATYRRKHREVLKERMKKVPKEKLNAYHATYRKNNPEKVAKWRANYCEKRRKSKVAKKVETIPTITLPPPPPKPKPIITLIPQPAKKSAWTTTEKTCPICHAPIGEADNHCGSYSCIRAINRGGRASYSGIVKPAAPKLAIY